MIGNAEKFAIWSANVARWRKLYPQAYSSGGYNPAAVKLKICKKCDSLWKLTRHHRGHEYLLAVIREDLYAERYIQFHHEDIVILCERCHQKIHKLYEPIVMMLYVYVEDCTLKGILPQQDKLEEYRKEMGRKCSEWLKRKMQKPSPATKSRIQRLKKR